MCLGGGSDSSSALRKQQQDTQKRIDQGMAQVNAIFGGGTYGTGAVKSPVAGTQYYNQGGSAIPTSFTQGFEGFGNWLGKNEHDASLLTPPRHDNPRRGKPFDLVGNQAKVWNDYLGSLAASGGLYGGQVKSEGFNDAFYNRYGQGFEDFALPQLSSQYDFANRKAQANLADRGVLGSSNATATNSALTREKGLAQQNVANQAIGLQQGLRQNVAQEKNNIINQLIASSDPGLASSQAVAAAANLNAPSPYPAIGNLFGNFLGTYMGNNMPTAAGQNAFQYGNGLRLPNAAATTGSAYSIN